MERLILEGKPRVIMSNPHSPHGYFAWPSIDRLQDGRLAVVASGFRLALIELFLDLFSCFFAGIMLYKKT